MPLCKVCSEPFSEERAALGYDTCLVHGEERNQYSIGLAYNKGPYVLITDKDLKELGTGAGKRR
jgi:hypothetical protein